MGNHAVTAVFGSVMVFPVTTAVQQIDWAVAEFTVEIIRIRNVMTWEVFAVDIVDEAKAVLHDGFLPVVCR